MNEDASEETKMYLFDVIKNDEELLENQSLSIS